MPRDVQRTEFNDAVATIWEEICYQNDLPRRTADEAKDVPGFCTLLRRYLRQLEDTWADNAGEELPNGQVQVPAALDGLRKIAAIAVRGMIYNGIQIRGQESPEELDDHLPSPRPHKSIWRFTYTGSARPRGDDVPADVNGLLVQVVRELTAAEVDIHEVGRMYVVRTIHNQFLHVFHDELSELDHSEDEGYQIVCYDVGDDLYYRHRGADEPKYLEFELKHGEIVTITRKLSPWERVYKAGFRYMVRSGDKHHPVQPDELCFERPTA